MCNQVIGKETVLALNEKVPTSYPPCHLITVAKHRIEVFRVIEKQLLEENAGERQGSYLHCVASWEYAGFDIAETSPAANWLAICVSEGLNIIDMQNNFTTWKTLPLHECKRVIFSSRGTYLGVLIRTQPHSTEHNFSIWDVKEGKRLSTFGVPVASERWPPVMWSQQETFFVHIAPKHISIYENVCLDVNEFWERIPVENVQSMALSSEKNLGGVCAALFVPPLQKKPGYVALWSITTSSKPTLLTSQPLPHVQNVSFYWNHTGTALLILSQSDIDRSGRSYYGTSSLTFLEATSDGLHLTIIGEEEGPVSACQWCPTTNEFVAISGPIHSTKLILYDGKTGNPKISFGNVRRNCIRFNPFGRFLCFGGFGNLPGEVDIWDKNKKRLIGQTKIPITVEFEWAPNGRILMAATTTPRMRVDNCVKIIRYNGDLLDHVAMPDLYSCKWIPALPGTYPNRAASPQRVLKDTDIPNDPNTSGNNKYEAYRIPATAYNSQKTLNGQISLKNNTPSVATVIISTSKLPPGAQFVEAVQSKSARRNALRRKKNKEAREVQLHKTSTE